MGLFYVWTLLALKTAPLSFQHLIFGKDIGSAYPIADDAYFYLARIVSVTNGNFALNNPYFLHHSTGLGSYTYLGDYWLAFLTKLSSSIHIGYFLDTSIKVGIIYFCLNKIISRYSKLSILWSCFLLTIILSHYAVWLIRPVNPSSGVALLIAFTYLFQLKNQRRFYRSERYLYAVLCMAIWWTYPHLALVTSTAIGIAVVLDSLKTRKVLESVRAFAFEILSSLFGCVSWYLLTHFPNNAERKDALWRTGEIASRTPGGIKEILVGCLTLLLLLLALFVQRAKFRSVFPLGILLIASLIALNHQIVTGRYGENAAHTGTAIYIYSALIGIAIISLTLEENSQINIRRLFSYTLIVLLLLLGSFTIEKSREIIGQLKENSFGQDVSKIENVAKRLDSLELISVSAPNSVASQLPIYGKVRVLYSYEGTLLYPMTNIEILERNILNRMLQGEVIDASVAANESFVRHFLNFEGRKVFDEDAKKRQINYEKKYWENIASELQKKISRDIDLYIEKYKVNGIVLTSRAKKIEYSKCKTFYEIGNFLICDLR